MVSRVFGLLFLALILHVSAHARFPQEEHIQKIEQQKYPQKETNNELPNKNDSSSVYMQTKTVDTSVCNSGKQTSKDVIYVNSSDYKSDMVLCGYIAGGALLLIFIMCIVFFVINKRMLSKLSRKVVISRDEFNRCLNIPTNEVANLKRDISELKLELYHIKQIVKHQSCVESMGPVKDGVNVSVGMSSDEPNVLYFASPQYFGNKGGFSSSNAKTIFQPGVSKYKLTINSGNNNMAVVEFCADDFKDAVNQPSTYIDPVCKVIGKNTANVIRIINIEPGEAQLQSDKWIVLTKATVKYE